MEREIGKADKSDNDDKLVKRRMASIENYGEKIYKLCGYEYR